MRASPASSSTGTYVQESCCLVAITGGRRLAYAICDGRRHGEGLDIVMAFIDGCLDGLLEKANAFVGLKVSRSVRNGVVVRNGGWPHVYAASPDETFAGTVSSAEGARHAWGASTVAIRKTVSPDVAGTPADGTYPAALSVSALGLARIW